jgi:hypothetical protein
MNYAKPAAKGGKKGPAVKGKKPLPAFLTGAADKSKSKKKFVPFKKGK